MRMIGAILVGALLTYMVGQSGRAPLSTATPTYYRDVLPILQKHCEVCHRAGGIAPISLASYEMGGRYADAIQLRRKTGRCRRGLRCRASGVFRTILR